MKSNLLESLINFNYNESMNIEEEAPKYFKNECYSLGCSKVVFYRNKYVIKKIFKEELMDEANFYNQIKDSKFKYLFCPTKKIRNDITLQRRVDKTLREYIREEENKIPYGAMREFYKDRGLTDLLLRTDCVVLYYLYRQMGLEGLLEFQDFVVENGLNDLYNYNTGFIDGKIKFFDFGGSINWD